MAQYRTLAPITYTDNGKVIQILKAGVLVELSSAQAAALIGLITWVGSNIYTYSKADVIHFATFDDLPVTGELDKVYLAGGALYLWDGSAYSAMSGGSASWSTLSGKPAVIAAGATQTAARNAIDAASSAQGAKADSAVQPGDLTVPNELTDLDTTVTGAQLDTLNSVAVRATDTATTGYGFVVDEDSMTSDSATKLPTQQSVKAYVDAGLSGKANTSHTHILANVTDVTATAAEVNALHSSGVSTTDLSRLAGVTSGVQAQLNAKQASLGYTAEDAANKGVANGYAGLDGSGKIPITQLPSSVMEYQGSWDASINTPTLADGVGDRGDVWRVSEGGVIDLGSGPITFNTGDYAIYNGTTWERSGGAGGGTGVVTSVAGKTGDVAIVKADVGLANVDNTSDSAKNSASATLTNKTISGADNTLTNISADSLVDGSTNKAYTATEKSKLSGIAASATANDTDANLKNRGNHTGSQTASTISDFSAAADARITAAIGTTVQGLNSNLTAIAGLTPSNNDIVQRKSGAWTNRTPAQFKTDLALAKGDVGLGNVTNNAQYYPGGTDVAVADGGTGVSTLTGIVKGNGTSAFTAATAGTDYVAPGGALGTPSSGTLTNCTFPTLNQSTTGNAATATKLATARTINGVSFDGTANITVADATKVDKSTLTTKGDLYVATASGTITRIGVGSNGQVLQADSSQTAGVKWATPGSSGGANSMSFSATPTFDLSAYDQFNMTLTGAITSATFTGGIDGKVYRLRFTDDGTARAIALGSTVREVGTALPPFTVAGKPMYLSGIWNAADSTLDLVGAAVAA